MAKLPHQVTESSGLAVSAHEGSYWTHNDGGSSPVLYEVDSLGDLGNSLKINGLANVDWEDIARSPDGRLFIGDFGNNSQKRTDLSISILEEGWESGNLPQKPAKITFRYAGQQAFPPPRKQGRYDAEAFFFFQDSLYLFSKNTGKNPRYTHLYKMPAVPGDYTLIPADSMRLNETVTGADISPDGTRFVLLTYGKILWFGVAGEAIDFSRPLECLRRFKGQTEAVVFLSNNDLLLTNERGQVFKVTRRDY